MYSQNPNFGNTGAVNVAALVGDPNAIDRLPGMELTPEQKEISKKDREKLVKLLLYVMIAQLVGIIGNFAVGGFGVLYYDSYEGTVPNFVGSFICGTALIISIIGAFTLRNMALNFKPENKQKACCSLVTFESPTMFILIGCMMTVLLSASSNTFGDECDEGEDSSDDYDCTSNPDADEYRTVAIVAFGLVAYNIGLAIAAYAVMCTSPKAFATNQVAFNRAIIQTVHNQPQTMMAQQQLILQQQLALQQQMQSQQVGMQPLRPIYGEPTYPPPQAY